MMTDSLYLIIPCYNDSSRLAKFLPPLCEALTLSPISIILTIVDDGSSAKEKITLEMFVGNMRERFSFLQPVIHQATNQGKGAAIMLGWQTYPDAAWYGFLDADGSVPAYEVLRLIHLLAETPDKNISFFASRIKMYGKKVVRSMTRHYSGRIFASMVGVMIDPQIYDSQCGFKIIPQAAYQKIKIHLQEKRFAFDVELLAALNHFNFPVEEIPIDWSDISGSKVSLFKDSFSMFYSLLAIRLRRKYWRSQT